MGNGGTAVRPAKSELDRLVTLIDRLRRRRWPRPPHRRERRQPRDFAAPSDELDRADL